MVGGLAGLVSLSSFNHLSLLRAKDLSGLILNLWVPPDFI